MLLLGNEVHEKSIRKRQERRRYLKFALVLNENVLVLSQS